MSINARYSIERRRRVWLSRITGDLMSSDAFASLLSEARKFATHFVLANQYTDQLSHSVRSAVIGNAGSLVVLRIGSRDAECSLRNFAPWRTVRWQIRNHFPPGSGEVPAAIELGLRQSCFRRSVPPMPFASKAVNALADRPM